MFFATPTAVSQLVLLLASLLIFATALASPVEYTLDDFNVSSVNPGLTILTIDATAAINAPYTFANSGVLGSFDFTGMEFDPIVGVARPPDVENSNDCLADNNEKDYIMLVRSWTGCTFEQLVRTHKNAGAKGVVLMVGWPITGLTTMMSGMFEDTTEFNGYPTLTVGGFARGYIYSVLGSAGGNDTVVALASGDSNKFIDARNEFGLHALLYFTGILACLISISFAIYVRVMMKKYLKIGISFKDRTIASTWLEIALLASSFRLITALDFKENHFLPYAFVIWPYVLQLFLNQTGGLLLAIYWLSLSSSSSVKKGAKFLNNAFLVAFCALVTVLFVITILANIGDLYYNGKILTDLLPNDNPFITSTTITNFFRNGIFYLITAIYLICGIKFILYLRNSSMKTASSGGIDRQRRNMLLKIFSFMILSSFLIISLINISATMYGPNSGYWVYLTYMGQQIYDSYTMVHLSCVSMVQVLCFYLPILKKMNDERASTVNKSASGASSSSSVGTSSSATSSSSNTNTSSSSAASSSATGSSNAASSTI